MSWRQLADLRFRHADSSVGGIAKNIAGQECGACVFFHPDDIAASGLSEGGEAELTDGEGNAWKTRIFADSRLARGTIWPTLPTCVRPASAWNPFPPSNGGGLNFQSEAAALSDFCFGAAGLIFPKRPKQHFGDFKIAGIHHCDYHCNCQILRCRLHASVQQ